MNIKKITDKSFLTSLGGKIVSFFNRQITLILLIVFLGMVTYGIWFWYQYIYHPDWSENRRQEYMKTKDKGAVFNKVRFNEIVTEYEARQKNEKTDMSDLADIFRLQD